MEEIIAPALNIGFLIIAFAMALILALAIYIYVKYGRTPSITLTSSIMVIIFFIIATLAAYTTLQNLISLYA